MGFLDKVISYIPEVKPPTQKKLSFNAKLKWTGIVIALYFLLGLIPLYGLESNVLSEFEFLSTVLGAQFGSLITLGIGPIVTASIILQLLKGAGILNMDLTKQDGKRRFQGIQRLLAIIFVVVEAFIFVLLGGLVPEVGISPLILVAQITLGGLFIILMDDIISKYGFGSGVSLFIAAGVSQQIFIQLFSPYPFDAPAGMIPIIFTSLFGAEASLSAVSLPLARVIATLAVFFFVVYVQAMKVEIPLSFGKVSGHGVRWPLNFLYANVLPIILVAALLANLQILASLLQNRGNDVLASIVSWTTAPAFLEAVISNSMTWLIAAQALTYVLVYVVGATIFSVFWVQTSGLDAASQAKQMVSSGLQIPGFRRDPRVLERLLKRYIGPLTIMGGITIGLLASAADLTQAIGSGTGILLAVMIIYKLYEDIAKQHLYDMNPAMRKFISF
ncbi:MAG: preprotein translocase subunit SecY [Candidatus Woesearchaeota archaeon]